MCILPATICGKDHIATYLPPIVSELFDQIVCCAATTLSDRTGRKGRQQTWAHVSVFPPSIFLLSSLHLSCFAALLDSVYATPTSKLSREFLTEQCSTVDADLLTVLTDVFPRQHSQVLKMGCYTPGQEKLAHGRASADHCHLRESEHAAAPGIPLHPHQLLHQAGRL